MKLVFLGILDGTNKNLYKGKRKLREVQLVFYYTFYSQTIFLILPSKQPSSKRQSLFFCHSFFIVNLYFERYRKEDY